MLILFKKRSVFSTNVWRSKSFPKANEMRKFFLCLLCNGQPNEKKTFQQVMTAEAFQVKKDSNIPTKPPAGGDAYLHICKSKSFHDHTLKNKNSYFWKLSYLKNKIFHISKKYHIRKVHTPPPAGGFACGFENGFMDAMMRLIPPTYLLNLNVLQ